MRVSSLSYRLDGGSAHRAAIGLIALATDATIEWEWRRLLALDGVAFFVNRIPSARTVTAANLQAMEVDLARAAELILPGADLDVIAYGCTSASMLIGEETVGRHLRGVRPGIAFTTPITAAKAAFAALEIDSIALLSPYSEPIHQAMRRHLEQSGLAVPVAASFHEPDDVRVAHVAPASVRDAVLALGREPQVEAVFVSCTNLRAAEPVEALETELDKPVTSSCHAMAWHALRLAGFADPLPDRGRLFRR